MSLSELTSREAVLSALAEYDALGQEAFLVKYGYGAARSYYLVHNGRQYDSKAIAGVAYGYQHPERGPLRAGDFSGGAETVQRHLEELGFIVTTTPNPTIRLLERYQDYTRAEVHAIFAPNTRFTPQSGTWGLQGIISIPDRPQDFVFFVTFGQQQGDHVFEEGITEDGILTWQSQPRQRLQDSQIQQFIIHDDLHHTIYLFLRTSARRPYTYLGQLRYVDHDPNREQPVFFLWQILDWELPAAQATHMGLTLQPPAILSSPADPDDKPSLTVTSPPTPRQYTPRKRSFQARGAANDPARDARQRSIGQAGELLVMKYEQERLTQAGRADLALAVRHVAALEGDGAGYDIASWTDTGAALYIEVKTTTGDSTTPFFMTANEYAFAIEHTTSYWLYRIYQYDSITETGKMYKIKGNPAAVCQLTPIQFSVSYQGSPDETI